MGIWRTKGQRGFTAKLFRCVYCKKRLIDVSSLPSHEAQCPARDAVRRGWAWQINKAIKQEQVIQEIN